MQFVHHLFKRPLKSRRQKLLRKQKMDTKQEVHRFIERIVHEMVDTAVDTAAGHGARMKLAGGTEREREDLGGRCIKKI